MASFSDLFDEQSEVTDTLIGFLAEPSEASEFNINTLLSWKPEICRSQASEFNINLISNQRPETRLSLEDTEFNGDTLLSPQTKICLAKEDIGFDMPSLLNLDSEIKLLMETEPAMPSTINCSVRSAPHNVSLDQAGYSANSEFAPVLRLNQNLSDNHLSGTESINNPSNVSLHHDSYNVHAEIAPAPLPKRQKGSSNLSGTKAFKNPENFVYQGPGFTVGSSSNEVQRSAVPALQHVLARNISARQRRKKISHKTNELAKLIPGGTRLGTADMLLASIRYVKFMQAQVGVLAHMVSNEARDVPLMAQEHLQVLLGSATVQKILASEEKCLVPTTLAENWAQQNEIQSSSVESRDLDLFLKSIN